MDTLAICYNPCELVVDNVYRDIEEALKSQNSLPDCVYIIGSEAQYAVYEMAWESKSSRLNSMLMRGMKHKIDFVKQYVFLEWKEVCFVEHLLGPTSKTYNVDCKQLLTKGAYSLLNKNNAIHQAPSGHVFKHPSGNKNKLFIQAREIG